MRLALACSWPVYLLSQVLIRSRYEPHDWCWRDAFLGRQENAGDIESAYLNRSSTIYELSPLPLKMYKTEGQERKREQEGS